MEDACKDAIRQLAKMYREADPESVKLYSWPKSPAKILNPDGKWMYFVGEETVSKSAYKAAVAAKPPATADARKAATNTEEKPAEPAPTRMNFWKSGDASYWIEGKRVMLEEFIAHFVPDYDPNKEFTVGGKTFWINRVAPKYSVYTVDGKTERKAVFLAALNKALTGKDMVVDAHGE